MHIDEILNRLKARPSGRNKWQACCPAHQDKSPSLSIKEADNGNVLIYCFAGCSVVDVCAAIGITPKDLFADGSTPRAPRAKPIDIREQADTVAQRYAARNAEFLK